MMSEGEIIDNTPQITSTRGPDECRCPHCSALKAQLAQVTQRQDKLFLACCKLHSIVEKCGNRYLIERANAVVEKATE